MIKIILITVGVIIFAFICLVLLSCCIVSAISNSLDEELFRVHCDEREKELEDRMLVLFDCCDDENVTLEECESKFENEGKEVLLDNGHILGWTV